MTAPAPTARRWTSRIPASRGRLFLLGLVALSLITLGIIGLSDRDSGRPLDPAGFKPAGAHALAQILRDQGVEIEVVRSLSAATDAAARSGGDTSLVIGESALVGPEYAARILAASGGLDRIVLLDGSQEAAGAFHLPIEVHEATSTIPHAARCSGAAADLVGTGDQLTEAAYSYRTPSDNAAGDPANDPVLCFPLRPEEGSVAVFRAQDRRPRIVVLGAPGAATNHGLASEANAAILLRTLGGTPRLLWYVPSVIDLDPTARSAATTAPWARPMVLLLGLLVVLLALVRGRRLGRLVTEPLPIVVPAAETTRSRADLYRRARDRGRAAAALRQATARRLRDRLALPRAASDADLARVAASHSGYAEATVLSLLTGPPPRDERALLDLMHALRDLEEKVSSP